MDMWQILNIEPTKEKRVIKRAYAKLLAKHHPEDEPEEFQKLHRAYEDALFYANSEWEWDEDVTPIESPVEFVEDEDVVITPDAIVAQIQYVFEEEKNNSILSEDADIDMEEYEYTSRLAMDGLNRAIIKSINRIIDPTTHLKEFVNSELFQQAKFNPIFIESCVDRLSFAGLTYFQLDILRNAFYKSVKDVPHMQGVLMNCVHAIEQLQRSCHDYWLVVIFISVRVARIVKVVSIVLLAMLGIGMVVVYIVNLALEGIDIILPVL